MICFACQTCSVLSFGIQVKKTTVHISALLMKFCHNLLCGHGVWTNFKI